MRKYSVRNRIQFRCNNSFFLYPWPLLTSFLYQFVERWHSLILRVACDEKSNQSKDVLARSIPDLVIPLHQEKLLAILHSQYHSSFASNNFQRKRSHWVDFRVGHSHQSTKKSLPESETCFWFKKPRESRFKLVDKICRGCGTAMLSKGLSGTSPGDAGTGPSGDDTSTWLRAFWVPCGPEEEHWQRSWQ